MEKITIQLTHARAGKILKELEELHLIRILKENGPASATISEKFAGRLSSKTADKLQSYIDKGRDEWERNI